MENKFAFAKEIVKEAASYIRKHMKDDLHVERKTSPTDLVTRLDKEVQNFLVDRIRSHYPDDQFCAEEGCLRASVGHGSVLAPKFPSIHSTVASFKAFARFVTKL